MLVGAERWQVPMELVELCASQSEHHNYQKKQITIYHSITFLKSHPTTSIVQENIFFLFFPIIMLWETFKWQIFLIPRAVGTEKIALKTTPVHCQDQTFSTVVRDDDQNVHFPTNNAHKFRKSRTLSLSPTPSNTQQHNGILRNRIPYQK